MDLITPAAQAETIKALVDSSYASRFIDLGATLGNARLAIDMIEEAPGQLPDELVVAAWTQYGNAHRLLGRNQEAQSALDRAGALPISHLQTKLHLLEVRSCLERNTRRYESAERSLAEALAAHESLADPVGLARTYNLLGLVYSESGARDQALRAFQTAFGFLRQEAPLDLLTTTGHNLFHTLIAVGRLEAAEEALASLVPFYNKLTSPRLAAKASWMRARLFRRLGRRLAARRDYQRAVDLLRTAQDSPELARLVQEMADF